MSHDYKTVKSNCTTAFLVRPLGIDKSALDENGFVAAYLGDINKPEIRHEKGIFMLFKPPSMALFEDFLQMEKHRTYNIVEDYDYEGGFVIVIYLLEDEFSEDYEKFLLGQYSKFSKKFKATFPRTIKVRDNLGRIKNEEPWQWKVFKKDKELRRYWEEEFDTPFTGDMEVWRVPNLEEEQLNINKIREEKDVYKQ